MTDGQTESLRAMLEDENKLFLAYCKGQIEYGVPGLTIDEQRLLWELKSGEKLPKPPARCRVCLGDGCDTCGHTGLRA